MAVPGGSLLALATTGRAGGDWSAFDAAFAAVGDLSDLPTEAQACILDAAALRQLARGAVLAARRLVERLEVIGGRSADGDVHHLRDRRRIDVAIAEGRIEDAVELAIAAAAGHPEGDDRWLEHLHNAAFHVISCRDLRRAAELIARLRPHAGRLAAVGGSLDGLVHRLHCAGGEHARVLARADEAAALGPAFVAAAAVEAGCLAEARRWIDRLAAGTTGRRLMEAYLAIGERRWRRAEALLALLPETPGGADSRDAVGLRLNASLARRQLAAARAALGILDPGGDDPRFIPERARLAVLEGDLAGAAARLRTLLRRGSRRMVAFLIGRSPEWDGRTVAELLLPADADEPPAASRPSGAGRGDPPVLVGGSPAMHALRGAIATCARLDLPVLITGETGTGKEVVARLLHQQGCPPGAPFAAINCAALTDSLAEAELFGHVAGAFTGAAGERQGLIDAAAGGVLFLDEVNSMSLRLQGLLLRLLETGGYRPLGSARERSAACRFLIATNQDLAAACAAGTFRTDLRYRLERLTIDVPPLRERREDIPALCRHIAERLTGDADAIPAAAIDGFARQAWPGNVRELRNAVERRILLASTAPAPAAERRPAAAPIAGAPGAGRAARDRRRRIAALAGRLGEVYQADVVRELGCNRKTAAADLEALRAAGVLIRTARGRHGRMNPYLPAAPA